MGFWDSINNMINTAKAGHYVDAMQELEGTGFPTYKYRGDAAGNMTVTPEQKNEFMNDVLTRLKEIDKELYEIERDYKIQDRQINAQYQRGGCLWSLLGLSDSTNLSGQYYKRREELLRQRQILQILYDNNKNN